MAEIPPEIKERLRLRLIFLQKSRGDLPLETEMFRKFLEELEADHIEMTIKIKKFLMEELKRIYLEYGSQGGNLDELIAVIKESPAK